MGMGHGGNPRGFPSQLYMGWDCRYGLIFIDLVLVVNIPALLCRVWVCALHTSALLFRCSIDSVQW
jgi:hypothetical protein